MLMGIFTISWKGGDGREKALDDMTEKWAPFGEFAEIDLPLGRSAGMRCIGDKHIRIMTLRVPK